MLHTLLTLPNDRLSNCILQYLAASDLWRLGAVCRKFHSKDDLEKNVVERELKARDDALILSKQYPPQSSIMAIFDYRQRVLSFERCRELSWKMTRETQQHEECSFSCEDYNCKYPELDMWRHISGNDSFFFAQFITKMTKCCGRVFFSFMVQIRIQPGLWMTYSVIQTGNRMMYPKLSRGKEMLNEII